MSLVQNYEFLKKEWDEIISSLEKQIGTDAIKNWISKIYLVKGDRYFLLAQNSFVKDWINTYYIEKLRKTASQFNKEFSYLCIFSINEVSMSYEELLLLTDDKEKKAKKTIASGSSFQSSGLNSNYTFGSFISGKSNQFAYAAARRVAEKSCIYNPLCFCGPVGHGKTHLMQAIGVYAQEKLGKRVLYVTAEAFMYEFITSLRHKTIIDFKKRFRDVDILMLDDIQFISGKESTQEEFFHTFNTLISQNKQVIISTDKFPSELAGITDRIKSRLVSGLVATIEPCDYELRIAILHLKSEEKNIKIDPEAIEFLAQQICTNIRELSGTLTTLAVKYDNNISLEDVKFFFTNRGINKSKENSISNIRKSVCNYFSISMEEIDGKNRSRDIVYARQIAIYLSKNLTKMSFSSIGEVFGKRDHTTILHACKTIEQKISLDKELRLTLSEIQKSLE